MREDHKEWLIIGSFIAVVAFVGLMLTTGFHQPTLVQQPVEQPPITDEPIPPVPVPADPVPLPTPKPDVPVVPEEPEPTPLPSQPIPKQQPLPQANKSTASTAHGGTVEAEEVLPRGIQ